MGKTLNYGNISNNFDDTQELSGAVKKITSQKKSNSDYIRLDLKPTGYDLKDYVIKKAAAKSAIAGKNISITQYIQDLIVNDMQSGKEYEPTQHEKLMMYFDNLNDDILSELMKLSKAPEGTKHILQIVNTKNINRIISQLDDSKLDNLNWIELVNQLDDKKIKAIKQLLQ